MKYIFLSFRFGLGQFWAALQGHSVLRRCLSWFSVQRIVSLLWHCHRLLAKSVTLHWAECCGMMFCCVLVLPRNLMVWKCTCSHWRVSSLPIGEWRTFESSYQAGTSLSWPSFHWESPQCSELKFFPWPAPALTWARLYLVFKSVWPREFCWPSGVSS